MLDDFLGRFSVLCRSQMKNDTAQIILGNGGVALIDADMMEALSQYTWLSHSPKKNGIFYVRRVERLKNSSKRKYTYMHRQIMNAPQNLQVDHINNNPLDNRRDNLRLCTQWQNACNQRRHRRNISGYKGIYVCGKRWGAVICPHRTRIRLGIFDSKEEAAMAYNEAAKKYFGEFANLNALP